MTQRDRLLHALRANPNGVSAWDLSHNCGLRYGARLKELRDEGYVIDTIPVRHGNRTYYSYRLVLEPRAAPHSDRGQGVAGTPAALGCEDTLFDLPAAVGRSAITGRAA